VQEKATKEELSSPYRLRWLDHSPFTAADPDRHRVGTPYISQLSLTRKVGWGVEVEGTGRTAHTHIHRDTSWLIYGNQDLEKQNENLVRRTVCTAEHQAN